MTPSSSSCSSSALPGAAIPAPTLQAAPFGKHKLCPVVSPKKTVEGAIGGVLGTMVFGVAATLDLLHRGGPDGGVYPLQHRRFDVCCHCAAGPVWRRCWAFYGDLFASVVKRQCGIKDYGTIFPGHGGILDRFDSVMFIAPFVTMVITAVFYSAKHKEEAFDVEKNHACWAPPAPSAPRAWMSSGRRGMRCLACRPTAMWIKFSQQIEEFHPQVCLHDRPGCGGRQTGRGPGRHVPMRPSCWWARRA